MCALVESTYCTLSQEQVCKEDVRKGRGDLELNPKYEQEVEITYNVLDIAQGAQATNINQRKSKHSSVREKGNIKTIYTVILNVVRHVIKIENNKLGGEGVHSIRMVADRS